MAANDKRKPLLLKINYEPNVEKKYPLPQPLPMQPPNLTPPPRSTTPPLGKMDAATSPTTPPLPLQRNPPSRGKRRFWGFFRDKQEEEKSFT